MVAMGGILGSEYRSANPAPTGLRVNVLRRADGTDCTLDGLSSRHTALTVIGIIDERLGGQHDVRSLPRTVTHNTVTVEAPAVFLGVRGGRHGDMWCIIPAGDDYSPPSSIIGRFMFGGHYVAADHLESLTGHTAIKIHDRDERAGR